MKKQRRKRCGICGGPNYVGGKYCPDCRLDFRKDLERARRKREGRRLNEEQWPD